MGQNTLMFEVGLERAKNKYQEVYDEVMNLVNLGRDTIKLKVQLDKMSDVQELIKQLSSLGDGTLLKPLLDRIDKLKTQLDVLGVDGSRSIERLKTEYNEATEAVQKYYRMVKQMEANIAGAKTPDLKKTFEKNLEAYKSNNKIEELTNRQVTAQLNLAAAEENVAKTAQAAAAALSNVGQGAAIKEVKDQVDALAKGLNDIVNEMKSIGNIGGGNLVKNVSKADEKTTQIAQALTQAMNALAEGKAGAAGKENELAVSTRDVNSALTVEKELVNETTIALNNATNSINAAAIAAKSLAAVMGGNSSDVNKFLELANRMDTLNVQARAAMVNPNLTYEAKKSSLATTQQELEAVVKEMDELKKNAAVGNPLIDSFTTAFNALNNALSSSGNLLKTAAGNMGELNANIGSVISKGNQRVNIGGNVAAQKEEEKTVQATNEAYQQKVTRLNEIEKRLKELAPLFDKVRAAQDKMANQRAGYSDWISKQIEETESLKNSIKLSQKAREYMAGATVPIADALGYGQKNVLKYAQALEKLSVLREFSGADGTKGFEALRKRIQDIEMAVVNTKDKLAKGLFPPEHVDFQRKTVESLEYRLGIMREIEQRAQSIVKLDNYNPRGYNKDEHLALLNEKKGLQAEIDQLKQQGAQAAETTISVNKKEAESNKEVSQSAKEVIAALKEKAEAENSTKSSTYTNKTKKDAEDTTNAVNEEADAFRKLMNEMNTFKGSIESLVGSIRSLVEQLSKMHSSSTPQIIDNNALLAQAKVVEDLKQKMSFLLSEGLRIPKSAKSYDAAKEYGIVEKQYKNELAKFNEMLTHGSSAVGSYAQAIQQLGQKYNFTLEQASKLASLIGSGELKRGDVQRGLGIGYNRAGDIVETINALKQLKQEELKPATQGGLFDQNKFTGLQDAIDKVIKEVNRLQEAFTKLGENNSLSNLTNLTRSLEVTLSTLSNAFKFTANTEELAAYEAKIKSLQQTITQLEGKTKELTTSLNNANAGIKTQAEKKGSEDRLADNLQKLKSTIRDVKSEYARLNEAYGQARTMEMPQNDMIEQRLFLLRELIRFMQDYSEAAKKAGSAEADALSKSKAFSFLQFNGNQLFSKENTRLYNPKDIDGYIKMVDEFIKADGRMAQTSGAATNTIAEIGTALSRAAERASQAGFSFSQTTAGIQNFAMNIETARLAYDKTLRGIADLENRISAGQKANMDKDTLNFMNGLKIRAQQWADVLKKILGEDLKGNPAYKEFLSISSSILTKPQMGNGLQALLGSEWKILLKDIGSTFSMLMKFSGFNKELTLDNASISNWLKAEEAVRRLENALKDLNRQWKATNKESRSPDLTARYETQKQAIESLIAQLKGAMDDKSRMANRNGLADLLGVGFKNAVGYDNNRLIQDLKATGNDAASAESRIRKLGMAFNELKGYIQANGGSEAMRKLQTEIQQAIQKMRQLMNAGDFSGAVQVFERISGAIRQATSATKEYEKSKQQAASANNQLTSSEQQLANAIKGSTEQMKGQSQVMSDLKMMATQYFSVWGAQSFLSNIIEIGGQLEMQRLSIGAILQDTEHANDLFEKIKTQALKSPFGVVELDAMTKQLSAYGFQYNELFDMTKRLADISAATGTGVDRLALALGHVRSEAALSGYTLRQFSMANIPLAKKLSEHLSEVEKRFVSVAEVRKRVRSKDIGYEEVVKVLKDLTNEGGMFYNAQEVMASSIKARFKNLRDAFAIMYGEIAESSVGDSLKELATQLTVLAKNWKAFIPLLQSGTMAFAAYKLSVLATNAALGANGASVMRNIMSYKQKQAAELQSVAIVRELTAGEKELIRTKDMLTAANIRVAMSTGSLTKADALRLVGLRKVSLEESKALVRMGLLSAAEVRAARAGSIMGVQMGKLGNQIKLLGASAATGVVNLAKTIINPWTIAFAAMSAGMTMWQNYKQRQEDMANYVDSIRSRSVEGSKNLTGTLENMNSVDVKKASADDLKMAISQIIDKLKDYDPSWQISLREAFTDEQTGKVRSQADQFERLRDALNETANAYEHLKATKDAFMNSDDKSGGKWYELQDRFSTNINDYNDAFDKYGKAATELAGHIDEVEEALKRAIEADTDFAEVADGKTMREQIDILMRNWNDYGNGTNFGAAKTAFEETLNGKGIINGLNEAAARMDNLNRAWWSLRASAERFKEQLYKDLVTNGNYPKDPSQWSKAQNDAVLMEYNAFFDQFAKNVPENMRSDIISMINDLRTDITGGAPWRIPVMFGIGEPKQELEGWRAEMQNWLDAHNLTFTITEEMSLEDIKKGIHAKIKETQEIVDNSGRVLIKVGLDTSNLPSELPQALQTPWNQYNFDRYNTNKKNVDGYNNFLDTYNIEHPKDKNKNKGEDRNAKAVRERVRVIKEAADAYQYWREKVGDDAAWAHVRKEFGKVLDDLDITANNIQDVRKHLNNIPNTKAYKAIKDKKVKTEVDKEIAKENDQYTRKDFEKQTEEFLSRTKIELDNLTRSWETFNSVREATGDISLAVKFSGAEYALGKAQNVADALKKQIEQDFWSVGAVPIPLDVELSERDIKKQVEEQFKKYEPTKGNDESEDDYNKRLLEYQSHIKSVVEEYKKWSELQRKVQDNAISSYMKMISDSESLKTKLAGVNDEYRKQIENLLVLKSIGKITPDEYDKGVEHATNTRNLGALSLLTNEVDWSTNDEFFGKIFREAGNELEKQLNKFIGSNEYNALDVTQQQQYLNIRDQLFKTGISGSNPLNPDTWKNLSEKTKAVQNAFKELMKSTLEYNAAVEAEENARKAAADAQGTPAEQMLNDRLKEATDNRVEAENQVTENQKKFKKSVQDQSQASSSAAKGLQDFSNAISGITSGSLSDLTLGIGNLVRSFMKGKDVAGSLSELLSGIPNGYGQIIAAALQLLDMLKDKSAETIRELLNGLFDAVTGIIKELLNGKLVEAIIESAVEGVGKIVSEIIANIPNMIGGGIFSGNGIIVNGVTGLVKGLGAGLGNAVEGLFGFDANNSNEQEVREAIENLSKENERLATVIEEATKELKESNGMRAINAAKEAKDAQSQYNANIMGKWREGMGYHSAHHSNAYSWDLEDSTQESVNAALREYAKKTGKELKQINVDNWEEFMTLTPEEMDYIRKHAQGAWEDITTEGKYEWVHEYLNEYADQAGKLEEMSEELREKLTLQSVSGLHDQFVNELMDMSKSAKDFSKDFSKMLMKAVLNAQIADLLDDQLKQWRDTMAAYMEEDGDNLSPAHIDALQDMWDDIVKKGLKIRDQVASATGYTGEGSSTGLSSNIKNITEQTADILASYINAIRADVAVDRSMIAQYFPMFYQSLTAGNDSLKNIENHTAEIMRSNDAIKDSNQAILDRINGLKNGTWQVPVA